MFAGNLEFGVWILVLLSIWHGFFFICFNAYPLLHILLIGFKNEVAMLKKYETPATPADPSIFALVAWLIGLSSALGIVIAGIFSVCNGH